jgi:Mrp family chromosome partitioning ATPase
MAKDDVPPRPSLPALQSPTLRQTPYLDYIRYSEFKRLLGQIAALVDQEKVKALTILSAYPQEGKTFMVAATALGYAILLHKRVLIVNTALKVTGGSLNISKLYDEQLKNAPVFGPGGQGARMIDLISPQMDDHRADSGADTLDFQIGSYINTFRHNYDLILLDTCALTSTQGRLIDPVVIAGQSDASILLTSDRSLNHDALAKTKEVVSQWRVRILGAIHNSRNGA